MSNKKEAIAAEWQEKSDKAKKLQFFRELEKIRLQKHTVERERIGFMYEKHDKQYSHLEDVEKGINEELKSERLKLEQQLKRMRAKVGEFQKELKHVKPSPEFVKKLKYTMEDIESTIGDFKQKQREIFEHFIIAEKEMEEEIAVLEGKINAIKDTAAPTSSRHSKARVKPFENNFPKEIQEFEAFVSQHGGKQGGWDDYDHGTFLRIRDKYKGNKSFIKVAARQIPGRSEQDIEDHERWYTHFVELQKKKKEVIASWRKKKEKENVDENSSMEDEEAKKTLEEQEERVRKRQLEERQAKKRELQTWKAQKQVEQEIEKERKLQEEIQRQVAEEKKRRENEAEMKAVRERLKEKREEEERLRWMKELEQEQVEMERQQEVRERISQFQTRDRVAISIKQNEQKRKQEMEILKKERLERTKEKVQVTRDPSRLHKLTEGWVRRAQDNSAEQQKNYGFARMPHRAVPAWRQNL